MLPNYQALEGYTDEDVAEWLTALDPDDPLLRILTGDGTLISRMLAAIPE